MNVKRYVTLRCFYVTCRTYVRYGTLRIETYGSTLRYVRVENRHYRSFASTARDEYLWKNHFTKYRDNRGVNGQRTDGNERATKNMMLSAYCYWRRHKQLLSPSRYQTEVLCSLTSKSTQSAQCTDKSSCRTCCVLMWQKF